MQAFTSSSRSTQGGGTSLKELAHCTTRVGAYLSLFVPSPTWPNTLKPQQYSPGFVVRPHVNSFPALICANVWPPATRVGLKWGAFPLSPTAPLGFLPQQYPVPVVVTPQECVHPAVIWANVRPPLTAEGTTRSAAESSPTAPSPPQ